MQNAAMRNPAYAMIQVPEQCVLEVVVSLFYITFYNLRETWCFFFHVPKEQK